MSYTSASNLRLGIGASPQRAFWLAGVLMLAGLFLVIDAVAAKTASTILFGLALLAAGGFEIVHAFWLSPWGALFLRLLLGLFYLICGGTLIAYPLASSQILSIAFAAALIASGVVRVLPGSAASAKARPLAVGIGHRRHPRGSRRLAQMADRRRLGLGFGGWRRPPCPRRLVDDVWSRPSTADAGPGLAPR